MTLTSVVHNLAEKEVQWNAHMAEAIGKETSQYKMKIEEITDALKMSEQKTQVRTTFFDVILHSSFGS